MLLNLHGKLAEQPSSCITEKGKSSLFTAAGKYLRTQKNPASVHYPSWRMRTVNIKMEKLIKLWVHQAGLAGWDGEFGGVGYAWGFFHLFDKPLMLEGILRGFSQK